VSFEHDVGTSVSIEEGREFRDQLRECQFLTCQGGKEGWVV
jgi:hypothetical protein